MNLFIQINYFYEQLNKTRCSSDSEIKNLPGNARDMSSIPGFGRSPGEGTGSPLQYSCLGNPMNREAWWATVYGVAKRVRYDLANKQQQKQKRQSNLHKATSLKSLRPDVLFLYVCLFCFVFFPHLFLLRSDILQHS